jgi:hypothetical protein
MKREFRKAIRVGESNLYFFMKKVLLTIFLGASSFLMKAQGINVGFGTGTEWVRLELGYSISDQMHAGARFVPGFNTVGIPSYYAGFFRYTFEENDFGGGFLNAAFRGYVGGSAGLIRLKGSTVYDIYNGGSSTSENRTAIGFSADAGGEILYGRSGKWGSFFELNIGQVPNYFNTLNNELNNTLTGAENETKLASIWGIAAGFRVYFGK